MTMPSSMCPGRLFVQTGSRMSLWDWVSSAISYAWKVALIPLSFPQVWIGGDCLTSIEVIQTSTGAVIFDSSGQMPSALEPLSLQVTAADGSYCKSTITFIADAPIDAHVASFAGISMYDYVHHHVPGIISCFVLGVGMRIRRSPCVKDWMCSGPGTWPMVVVITMLNQVFEVYGTAICRFRDLGEMGLDIPIGWIWKPEQIDIKGYILLLLKVLILKIFEYGRPSAQVYVGEGAADLIAHIQNRRHRIRSTSAI